jgi:hypothetical protein
MGKRLKTFLAGMGSVVDFYPMLSPRPSRPARPAPVRSGWETDREALRGDFWRAVAKELSLQNK